MGSYVTKAGASNIDYFICSNVIACVVNKIDYCNNTAPRPHGPVYLFFAQKPKVLQVLCNEGQTQDASGTALWA